MNQTIQQAVDQLLMEQGHYTPLELLLAEGRLLYCDYEAWRSGELTDLASSLFGDQKECQQLLKEADSYANKLNLSAETVHYTLWAGTGNRALCFSSSHIFDRLFHTRYSRSSEIPQLDLFMDATSTVLINGITQALVERNHLEARRQLDQLFDADPGNNQLGGLEQLVEAAEQLTAAVDDPSTLLNHLQQRLSPLAVDLLESNSRHFLTPQWQRLTSALTGHPFNASMPQLHSSYSAMQATDWQQVKESVESEEGWRQQPVLIRRHAQACGHLHQEMAATASWFLLCWHFPDQAVAIRLEAEPSWQLRWLAFMELEPELPNQDFPAWAIINEPGLVKQLTHIDQITAEPPEAWLITLKLFQGPPSISNDDLMAYRKALKGSNPTLFQHYLQRFNG